MLRLNINMGIAEGAKSKCNRVKRVMFFGLVVNNPSDCALKHLEVVTVVWPLMQGLGKPQGTLFPHAALSNTSYTSSHSLSMNVSAPW